MTTLLLKTEPDTYSFDDLVSEKRTRWDGVANPSACIHMRSARKGDEAFIYHTGKEKRIIGLARLISDPYEDPAAPGLNDRGEPKRPVFDIAPVRRVKEPLTLASMRQDARFEGFDLLRQSRLGVVPVPAKLDRLIRKLTGL